MPLRATPVSLSCTSLRTWVGSSRLGFEFRVWGFRFGVEGLGFRSGFEGLGFRSGVWGLKFGVSGSGF